MARRYRFLGKFSFDHTPVLAALMVTTSTKKSSQARMAFFVHKNAERCGRYVTYILMPKHQKKGEYVNVYSNHKKPCNNGHVRKYS